MLPRSVVIPLRGARSDYDTILRRARDASIILIGDGTHGTFEFYHERAEMTKRLICEAAYTGVVLESDFPATWKVDRYVNAPMRSHISEKPIPIPAPRPSGGGGFLRAHSGWGGGPPTPTHTLTSTHTPAAKVHHHEDDASINALDEFTARFPDWMWGNSTFLDFISWARDYVASSNGGHIGISGMDLYSLFSSTHAVVQALKNENDSNAASAAEKAYACFDLCGARAADDAQLYGLQAAQGASCAAEATRVARAVAAKFHSTLETAKLKEAASAAATPPSQPTGESTTSEGGGTGGGIHILEPIVLRTLDEAWAASENAFVVESAEAYYRTMFTDRRASSWNIRDGHMATFISRYRLYLGQRKAIASGGTVTSSPPAGKIVVWAHNSHLGDARATGMGARGEWNVGQLLRQKFGDEVVTVCMTTATGTVTAAHNWDGPACRLELAPPLPMSLERLFSGVCTTRGSPPAAEPSVPPEINPTHELLPRFLLDIRALEKNPNPDARTAIEMLQKRLYTRHVGVLYRRDTEMQSHYTPVNAVKAADFYIHIDHTRALEPLARAPLRKTHVDGAPALEETYPTGL